MNRDSELKTACKRVELSAKPGELPAKPAPPGPGECCGMGCVPCIWDYYHKAVEKWQSQYEAAGDNDETERRDKNNPPTRD